MRSKHVAFACATSLLLAVSCTAAPAGNSTQNSSKVSSAADHPTIRVGPKVLKVCTTGDYPPLANYNSMTGVYSGLAPTVLKHFGLVYGYDVEFVQTTRAALEEDLESGTKCLLAAGGITETEIRSARFGVSIPLLTDKKVPIFSKENAMFFKSFTDINQAGVTVIENSGGSNEAFVEALRAAGMLSQTNFQVTPSNEETWACLAQYPRLPMVMFADGIEAKFRAAMPGSSLSDAGVSFAMPASSDPVSYKVYLANKSEEGTALLNDLNRFLRGAVATGLFEAWRREAFAAEYRVTAASCSLEPTLV